MCARACSTKISCQNGLIVNQPNGKCAGNATGSPAADRSKASVCVAPLSIALREERLCASVCASEKPKVNKQPFRNPTVSASSRHFLSEQLVPNVAKTANT